VLEPLGGVVSASPVQTNHVGKEFFGKLMAQGQALRFAASLAGQSNAAVALNSQQPVASHALECRSHGGWRYAELFGQSRADGHLIVLLEFPDGLEVIFARSAGSFSGQKASCASG
jgi:hypothetical protein